MSDDSKERWKTNNNRRDGRTEVNAKTTEGADNEPGTAREITRNLRLAREL